VCLDGDPGTKPAVSLCSHGHRQQTVAVRHHHPLAKSRLAVHVPASSWALRALVVVAIVFLLQAAKPLLLPVLIAVALTFVLAIPCARCAAWAFRRRSARAWWWPRC
jgi:hypothetical protein